MYHCLDLLKSKWNDVSVKYDLESENVTRTITISKIASQARLVNVKAKGNCGFVIFAGDDENSTTIGYGLTDTLNIDNLPPAAVEEVVGGSVSVFVNNGDIYIIGAKEDAIVDVYTIDGVKIVSTTGNRVANLSCGIYIVRIDNLSFKVVI